MEENRRLIPITTTENIPVDYREGPIGRLVEYHNLASPFELYVSPELLIGTCMDHRIDLRLPRNFAYVLRRAGANLKFSPFEVSYAIAIGGVRTIAVIGHTQCGMVNVASQKEDFIDGLLKQGGMSSQWAEDNFMESAYLYEIKDEIDAVLQECGRLRRRYPQIKVAPMLYKVEDHQLYFVEED